jgi:hypothetical protein
MAYTIGPKFNNAIDGNNLATIYLEGDKTIDERNRNDWEQSLAGIKALGSGVGKARQWVEAEKIKDQLMEKLQNLQKLRDEANNELVGLNAMRDEAKGVVASIEENVPYEDESKLYIDPRSLVMPYNTPKKLGSLNYGQEDYSGKFKGPTFGRKAGL